jgi:hypothetical protein
MGCGGKAKRDIAFSPKQAPKAPPLRSAGAVHDTLSHSHEQKFEPPYMGCYG